MAEAAASPSSAIEAELFANSLECCIIVIGIVKGKIPNLLLDSKNLEGVEDFRCNIDPQMSAHFGDPRTTLWGLLFSSLKKQTIPYSECRFRALHPSKITCIKPGLF
jgi:hypothetical protein